VTLAMGSETAITNADLTDDGVWVEVVVDGSTLAPRIQLRGVPYARRAQDSLKFGGKGPAAFYPSSGGTVAGSVDVNPGTLSLYGKLALQGNDTWLRLNQGGAFSDGVYTPGHLRVDAGVQVANPGGVDSWFPYWPNGWNYLSGNGTIFRQGSGGAEYARIANDGWATLNGVWLASANPGDCPGGWTCNIQAWDISMSGLYYNVLAQRSDARLKKNIESLGDGLDAILKLRPVTFEWKDPKIDPGKQYGFIAQEVEKVLPKLVSENDKGYKLVDTIGVLPVTVKAVQELEAENDKLRTDVDQLRDEIEALKAGHPLPPRASKTAAIHWVGPVSLGGGTLVFAFGLLATVRRRRDG
jgi:hypothetical protein